MKTFMLQVGEQYVVLVQAGGRSQEYLCATRDLANRWLKLFQSPVRSHVSSPPAT